MINYPLRRLACFRKRKVRKRLNREYHGNGHRLFFATHWFSSLYLSLSESHFFYVCLGHNRPPRLSIPAHGFTSQYSFSSHESHVGHVIRPVSPNSSYRSSLHIDGMHVPRTTSTNGSISTRLARHAMTPRVGIRTSLFSAIEVSNYLRNKEAIRFLTRDVRTCISLFLHSFKSR